MHDPKLHVSKGPLTDILDVSGLLIIQSPRLTHTLWNNNTNNRADPRETTGAPCDGEPSDSRVDLSGALGMATMSVSAKESLWSSQIKEYHDIIGEAQPESLLSSQIKE